MQQAQKLESLGVMAGGIAHDFNNILSAILGNAELALTQIEHPAQVREALDQITGASRRATDLTRQMLAYAGKASLRTDVMDLRPLLADLLALVRASQSKKVEFSVVLPGTPLWVEVERAQITQVGLNLLTNAAEAMGDNVGIVSLSAGREAPHGAGGAGAPPEPPAGWVRFSVEDTGDGMSDDVQRRIFEPFYSTKQPGRGLGLSAVTGIIRALGGVLRVESRPGLGSRFDVFLPAAAAPPRSDAARTDALPEHLTGLVLVIDDEAAIRRICRRVLESLGATVVEAADGVDGLHRFTAHRDEVKAVVLDLTMPGIGGVEVLATIRRTHPTLPVIVASGYDQSSSATTIPDDAHVTFLQKPFAIELLRRAVSPALSNPPVV